MKINQRWLILATLLILALISYGIGFKSGAVAMLFIGAAFECVFWIGLFSKERSASDGKAKT